MKIPAFRRMIPAVAAAGLLGLAAPAAALAAPGSGAGTGGSSAGGSGFTVNDQGTISPPQDTDDQNKPVYYPNCAAVRAAGKAPLYASQPGYNGLLDPKHTGVACAPGSNTP
ncbi:excalibur calcium-binding domain-containing protein [Nocardia miyunensis]|uniref:excalibur calcium-binding domain-containing protein n=1 Tax=Nocardia miyunensis TaxID=282684 RepID=UPI000A56144B|nr:excalibur calcium-binding domain-containing protein [Nocardia miyunensis]